MKQVALEIFRRREQKYLITTDQYEDLITAIEPYMRPDKFGIDGHYTVSSLYFENPDNAIYYEKKNNLKFRQNLRLRFYNNVDLIRAAFIVDIHKHNIDIYRRYILIVLLVVSFFC